MDFTTLPSLSGEALTAALALDFSALDNDGLAAALTERKAHASSLFALTEPSVAQVNVAEAIVASIGSIEGEQATRAAAIRDATERFAAARATFSAEAVEVEVEETEEEGDEPEAEDTDEDAESEEGDEVIETAVEDPDKKKEEEVVTASVNHTTSQTIKAGAAAQAVARKVKRPTRASAPKVRITAANDVPDFSTGQSLDGMEQVTKALMNRVKGFAPFNKQAALAVNSQSGGQPVLTKFGVASFDLEFDASMVTTKMSDDYAAVKAAIKGRDAVLTASMAAPETLTAAGWCAPSETIYSFIADYVVDGLSKTPEVKAPRGGLNITTGPERSSQGAALDEFGFVQTEAQAEAGTVKTCETIVCPDFEDFRLDAMGYCYKIPLLTQKAYPELITDALRFANVLYAHKVNERVIADKVALSVQREFAGYGPSLTDSLEALSILAVKERRKWNVGENAVITVEAPVWTKEVHRADMSRRAGLSLDDVATDQKLAAHFAARKLNVEYVADWQELEGENVVLPPTFDVIAYPAGTFVKAIEDVINLTAVHDAASLSINEYTGVFFEQGYLLAKVGYGSSILTIPVNTAGEAGALTLTGLGDATSAGSF